MGYFLDEIFEKQIDDTGTTFKEKYPLKDFNFFITGPCISRNYECLYEGEYGPDLAERDFILDEDKMIISYTDKQTKQRVIESYFVSFSCWVHTSDAMVSKANVYVCRKYDTNILSAFSSSELMNEIVRRIKSGEIRI